MSNQQRVLIIDDEPDIRELLEITLGRMNLGTVSAGSLEEARNHLQTQTFNLCLTDMRLPDGDGLDLVKDIQQLYPQTPVAVITAHGSTETAITALKSGAFDFVSKPVDLNKLRNLVTSALKLSQPATRDPRQQTLHRIVGQSRSITNLRQQISKLARSQAPVCISGESGSGKELVARAIHAEGPRKDKEFIAINCGAIPTELMESEFFGHRKGSFTGADQDKIGLFQAAQGGSLFLDEIADLPLHMQVKLLRAIQEKSIRPLGSQTEIPVDIRLLSATHKDLAEQIDQGKFRQDLYYRINVIELQVPPLRERLDDIPLLIEHILHNQAHESGNQVARLDQGVLDAMQDYAFPGNIRELENMLQRACALADDAVIRLSDFPELQSWPATDTPNQQKADLLEQQATGGKGVLESPEEFSLERHLEDIERLAIQKALQESKWNRTAAARKLGMSFRSFRYRLKKLGLD
jgi:two-component system, NtrC family, response regulator PilR